MSDRYLPDPPEVAEARRAYAEAKAAIDAYPPGKHVPQDLIMEAGYRRAVLARLVRRANGTGGPGTALLDFGRPADELRVTGT